MQCQIGIYRTKSSRIPQWEALIYRHSDGHPDAVVPDIERYLGYWMTKRNEWDAEYFAARMLQYFCNKHDGAGIESERTGVYNYGICRHIHSTIDYLYKVHPTGIMVYRVLMPWRVRPRFILSHEVAITPYETKEDT